MQSQVEAHRSRTPAVVRKAAAGLVLLVVAVLALKIIIGFVTAIFWTVVVIAAVLAVIWAVKTLVW
ncbi:MAG TPA: hypothetical protein VMA77_07735 [Solirubrobacteraceae bacterium]|nr:hypothetical protein [Solirubrobacteraceae bacterium]